MRKIFFCLYCVVYKCVWNFSTIVFSIFVYLSKHKKGILYDVMTGEWENMDQQEIQKIINLQPTVMKTIIEKNGMGTKYWKTFF